MVTKIKSFLTAGLTGLGFLSVGMFILHQNQKSFWQKSTEAVWAELERQEGQQQLISKNLLKNQDQWMDRVAAQETEIKDLHLEIRDLKEELESLRKAKSEVVIRTERKPEERYVQGSQAAPAYRPRPEAIREKPEASPDFFD